MTWKPGQRKAQRALESPYVGVPEHLDQPLWAWIQSGLTSQHPERPTELAIDLRMVMPPGSIVEQHRVFIQRCTEDEDFMLDLIEAMLERYGLDDGRAGDLNDLLKAGNSAYVVKPGWRGLEERVAPGVKELVGEAVDAAGGSAGKHLANAWNEAYGRNPDPVKAYSEAVKAAEAALAQRVSPQNSKQTLGTMIGNISAKPSKWKFVIAAGSVSGVDTVLHLMRTLWDGQTSRHGGLGPTRAETPDEAKAAVHVAATLVQLGVSGAFDLA